MLNPQSIAQPTDFPENVPTAYPVFFRTYSRNVEGRRESWQEVCDRTLRGLTELGKLLPAEQELIGEMQRQLKCLTSGRWLWVGGTKWVERPENFNGSYNCTSTNVVDWRAFGLMMDLAMQGCGTGAVLEPKYIDRLPAVRNRLEVVMTGAIGKTPPQERQELTTVEISGNEVSVRVGDSRQGWVKSYQTILELASDEQFLSDRPVRVTVDISDVRPSGEALKGFGGMANPVKLPKLYDRIATILNKAVGRQLNSVECCLLIDEAAVCIVAGNIRRCLPAGALVHSESGLVPIEKIRIGDRVLTSKGFYPVTNFFDQGTQSLCRIKTEDGYLECTPDHKVAVLEDVYGAYRMVKAKDLKEDDRLIFVPKAIPGTATELPEFKGNLAPQTKRITIPALTADVAYFIGYLHGDGSVASDGWRVRFRVSEDQQQIIGKLIAVGELFGLDTHTLRTPEQCKTKAFELQFNSSALNQYLSQFKKAFTSIDVPDCILLGTANIRSAYLSGLADADGCFSQGVLVASVHSNFLRQVKSVYASLGITVRLCHFIRKRTGKWEGELVSVGEVAFDKISELFATHSLRYANSQRVRPKSFKDHGFPKSMVRPIVNTYQYHWGNLQKQMIVPTLQKHIPECTDLIPVRVKSIEFDVRVAPTYDIEVASIHEFMCEGILVSNSAGMRQFSSEDMAGASAKDNLWQQDSEGNWRIDPERDSLRMANHTRVFHRKPTEEECISAVRKQYYSGEGAIQWAGEAIARANADVVTPELKSEFISAYGNGQGGEWLKDKLPNLSDRELEHRLGRYGLNPCLTADTWIHTEHGARQIRELIGQQVGLYVNGELFSTTSDGFFCTGNQPVVCLQTKEGFQLRLTENHQLLKVTAQTQKAQYTEWVETRELQVGDRILLHNHRDLQPWHGAGSFEEGWLIGNFIGDGCFATGQPYGKAGNLRYWGDNRTELAEFALSVCRNTFPDFQSKIVESKNGYLQISSAKLWKLAESFGLSQGKKYVTPAIEEASYQFYCGFLRGLFDADGSVQGSQAKGISIRLAQSNLDTLQAVQRMLARLGIISSIYQQRRPSGLRMLPDSKRELAPYLCKEQHELVIANDNLQHFATQIGFQDPAKSTRLQASLANYSRKMNRERFTATVTAIALDGIEPVYDCTVPQVSRFDANGIVAHNCGEILMYDNHCNLAEVHLNTIDPENHEEQEKAFTAGALSVSALLHHRFTEERYRYSREIDPIVGVSFTGLFDFFVHAFGAEWLQWWSEGRPDSTAGLAFKQKEREYLVRWKEIVNRVVWEYCDRHGLTRPNRCTTTQPAGCLDRTALRIFDQGLLYADEIVEAGSGESKGLDLSVRNGIATDTAIANQPLNLVRITLENGRVLRMTPNHRLAIANQWVRADHLELGMDIDYSLGEYRHTEDALLLSLSAAQYTREGRKELLGHGRGVLTAEITTPTTLNPELGYFLGSLFGDGAMSESKDRVRFAFNEKELDLVERLQAIAQNQFGLTGKISHDPRNGGTRGELSFASGQLFDWLNLNQLQKGISKDLDRMPLAIRKSSRETILAFFCGLIDTDGCVRESGTLSIDSSSEAFIRNLQQVGEAVGLCFGIFHNTQGENFQGQKDMWGLSLSRMLSQPESLAYLNTHSRKCQLRPLPEPKRQFAFHPYRVTNIEFETTPDYSYDFAVSGIDDDDSWYWQGALKSHNTKSLLTGASPGWHPPKAQRFIRRITFRKNDPVALACLDYGYSVIPSQSDKDEQGNLLNDPFDERCTEWLVELPVAVSWADLPGVEAIDISKFNALAQFDFYMQVQRFYTAHNTSATLELRENEIEPLAKKIYEAIREDQGYISAALLARFDDLQTFPRLPFEPIAKERYDQEVLAVKARRKSNNFQQSLTSYDSGIREEAGPAGCDSDKCMLPEDSPA